MDQEIQTKSDNGSEVKTKKNQDAERAFIWVGGVIDSCTHPFHIAGAKKLIDYFKEMYTGKYGTLGMIDDLNLKLISKLDKIDFI